MNLQLKSTAPELLEAAKYYGLFSRIARKLGVTPQHVRQVAHGISKSKRVNTAIRREVERIHGKGRGIAA